MLEGLTRLPAEEQETLCRLCGVDSRGEPLSRLVEWILRTVSARSTTVPELEREVLTWMRNYWPDGDPGALTVAVTSPLWYVLYTLACIDTARNRELKFRFLDWLSAQVVTLPAEFIAAIQRGWSRLDLPGHATGAILDALEPELEEIRLEPRLARWLQMAGYLTCYATGAIDLFEERMLRSVGERTDLEPVDRREVRQRTASTFWSLRDDLLGRRHLERPEEWLRTSWEAATEAAGQLHLVGRLERVVQLRMAQLFLRGRKRDTPEWRLAQLLYLLLTLQGGIHPTRSASAGFSGWATRRRRRPLQSPFRALG